MGKISPPPHLFRAIPLLGVERNIKPQKKFENENKEDRTHKDTSQNQIVNIYIKERQKEPTIQKERKREKEKKSTREKG